jgi:pimeloyl-ACP methyl ester carboxylesterase
MADIGIEKLADQAQSDNEAAIVFVHGFTGDRRGTWRKIPDFLLQEAKLAGWDILFFGYSSHWFFDLLNIWSADGDLNEIAKNLATTPGLQKYNHLAFVAHSMGGLAVQRALILFGNLVKKTRHVVLFGTPSFGLDKAHALRQWKQQIKNMDSKGDFIKNLRADWARLSFDQNPSFTFLAVAGLEDQFVPPKSSHGEPPGEFPIRFQATIAGNHVSMLKAESAQDECVQHIIQQMTSGGGLGVRSAARLAVENGEFQVVVNKLWPIRAQLDDPGVVDLALALDTLGRREDAIQVLEQHPRMGTDVLGVLGGRYKRRWIAERRREDFDKAFDFYQQGYAETVKKQTVDHAQAFYHGINIAYLALAGEQVNQSLAEQMAQNVLEHCRQVKDPKQELWRLASEGDAYIILNRISDALRVHQQAASHPKNPWQALSIQEQTLRLADLKGLPEKDMEKLSGFYQVQ